MLTGSSARSDRLPGRIQSGSALLIRPVLPSHVSTTLLKSLTRSSTGTAFEMLTFISLSTIFDNGGAWMKIEYICILLSGIKAFSYANSAVQTDWSGGPYTQGPVALWDDSFDTGLPVNWYTSPGFLGLEYFPAFTLISSALNGPASIECIDLESDGDHDLLVCGLLEPGAVVVFVNQHSGSVWATIPVDLELVNAFCASSGDFNGDSMLDFVAVVRPEGCSWERYLVVYLGEADGTWQRITISEDCHDDRDLCPADVDGDGDLDFLCSIPGWAWFGWCENLDGSGTGWEWHTLFSYSPHEVWSSEPLDSLLSQCRMRAFS